MSSRPLSNRPVYDRPFCALDTECTGLDFRRKAHPYSVALHWEKKHPVHGYTWFRQWPVDPFTREVTVNRKDLKELRRLIHGQALVFHNAKFDIRALSCLGIPTKPLWTAYEDTLLASHVCCANESHKLKDLAIRFLEIPDDDEEALRARVKSIHQNEAKHYGWTVSKDVYPDSNDHVAGDYWMVAALVALGKGEKGDSALLERYNVGDAKRTIQLWGMYRAVLTDEDLWYPYNREKSLQKKVYRMETRGVTLIKRKLDQELKRYSSTAREYEQACLDIVTDKLNWVEINLNSGPQLQRLLFTNPVSRQRTHDPEQEFGFGLEPTKITGKEKKDGTFNFSTDKHEIPKLLTQARQKKNEPAIEFLSKLLPFRKNSKAASDLLGYREKAIPTARPHGQKTDWRLHPSLNQNGTDTTRFSHNNPNVAQVSKGDKLDKDDENLDFTLREAFGPTWGRIWYAFDYNQLQLRIFAKVANEKTFLQALRDGYDAHTWVATQIFDCPVEEVDKHRRRIAKNVNFGFIFGAGEKRIDYTSGIKGLSRKVAKLFPNAHDFMQKTIRDVRRHGYVTTLGGYRLPVRVPYAGVCYIVQGTEGDIVKNAMIDVDEYLEAETNDECFMTLQVHDELVFDFPRDGNMHETRASLPKKSRLILAEIARRMMKAGADLGVETPVACERIVKDWAHGVPQPIGEIYVRRYRRTGMHIGDFNTGGGGKNYPDRNPKKRKLVHTV